MSSSVQPNPTPTSPSDGGPVVAPRIMHVHAHPDDESSKGAASTAMYVAQGVQVHIVTCTGGERGSVLNAKMNLPGVAENLTAHRREEMALAAKILGASHEWLGYIDSGWPEGDPKPPLPEDCFALVPLEESSERLARSIRRERPHVLTTYDETGGYPHPDHIRCHEVSMAAIELAADPAQLPDAGPAWQVQKVYYHHSFNRPRFQALHDEMVRQGLESPYAQRLEKWQPDPAHDARITTRVECGEFFPVRDEALIAHATQIDPEGFFFQVPMEIQQRIWPIEEFELAHSEVEVELPETDLLAGLRGQTIAGETLTS